MIDALKSLAATQMHEVDCFAIITFRKKKSRSHLSSNFPTPTSMVAVQKPLTGTIRN